LVLLLHAVLVSQLLGCELLLLCGCLLLLLLLVLLLEQELLGLFGLVGC
jgi:hypothetical protein